MKNVPSDRLENFYPFLTYIKHNKYAGVDTRNNFGGGGFEKKLTLIVYYICMYN